MTNKTLTASVTFLLVGLAAGAVLERRFPTTVEEHGSLLVLVCCLLVAGAVVGERRRA